MIQVIVEFLSSPPQMWTALLALIITIFSLWKSRNANRQAQVNQHRIVYIEQFITVQKSIQDGRKAKRKVDTKGETTMRTSGDTTTIKSEDGMSITEVDEN